MNILKAGQLDAIHYANQRFERNFWKVQNDKHEVYIVFEDSRKHKIVIDFSENNMELIKNKTFCVNVKLGYVMCPDKTADGRHTKSYIHGLLMRDVPKPSPEHRYVDHINRIKTDNRRCNLRWATQTEQNMNTGKRARKVNARELPEEIKDIVLPKYVVYNYDKTTDQHFFTIEKHPNLLGRRPKTTKSRKVPLLEKLEQAKSILNELGTNKEMDLLDEKREALRAEYDEIIAKIPEC